MELLCVSFAQLHPPSDLSDIRKDILRSNMGCLFLRQTRLFVDFVLVIDIFDYLSSLSLAGTKNILSILSLTFEAYSTAFNPKITMFFDMAPHGFFRLSEILCYIGNAYFTINLTCLKSCIKSLFTVGCL